MVIYLTLRCGVGYVLQVSFTRMAWFLARAHRTVWYCDPCTSSASFKSTPNMLHASFWAHTSPIPVDTWAKDFSQDILWLAVSLHDICTISKVPLAYTFVFHLLSQCAIPKSTSTEYSVILDRCGLGFVPRCGGWTSMRTNLKCIGSFWFGFLLYNAPF